MLNVDEQQDDFKNLNKPCDVHIKNQVQEIPAAISPMKRKASMRDM